MKYYLQNVSAGFCGNAPFWWAKDDCGYTVDIDNAKLFTKEEAESIIKSTKSSHRWMMWGEQSVLDAVCRTVDIEKLR